MELGEIDDRLPSDEFEPEPASKRGPLFVAVALVLLIGIAAFLVWRRQAPVAPQQKTAAVADKVEAPASDGPAAAAIDVPPLDLSDPLVRELLGQLSKSPEIAAWLATNGLIRSFVTSVENVASGPTPARHLRSLAPTQTFSVEDRGRYTVIDRRSYQRYDGIADAVAGLDAAGLAKVYATLKPRLQEAYRELGHPDGNIDGAVETAIVRLLEVPVVESDVRLRPSGAVGYEFDDDRLEALSPAQKQLLRMGPRNVKQIQGQLRAVAKALQIPDARLP